jgi:hypothetical protein
MAVKRNPLLEQALIFYIARPLEAKNGSVPDS